MIKFINKLGYGIGNLGTSITYFAINFFYLYYLNTYLKIQIITAGFIIFAGRLTDTLISPFIGILSDKLNNKIGRKKIFIIFGSIPYGFSFFLLWNIPQNIPSNFIIILSFLSFCFYCIIHSVINVSYKSLVPAITDDYDSRTSLNTYRAVFSLLGIIIGGTSKIAVNFFDKSYNGLFFMGLFFGTIVALVSMIPIFSIKEKNSIADYRLKFKDILIIFKSKPFFILVRMFVFTTIGSAALISSLTFFCQNILNKESFIVLLTFILSGVIGVPLLKLFEKHYEKKNIFIIAVISAATFIFLLSIFINKYLYLVFLFSTFIAGLLMSAYHVYPYSLLPDVINHFEMENKKRFEAVFYGIWIFINNIAGALGILFTSLIIGIFEKFFNKNMGIRLSFGALTLVFFTTGMLFLLPYPITKKYFKDIKKTIS